MSSKPSPATPPASPAPSPPPPTSLRGIARWRWLRSAARRAAKHPRERLDQVIALGRLLLEAKRVVGHGEWREWIRDNLPYGYRIAREAMRAAIRLGGQSGAARNFGPSAVRVLANRRFKQVAVRQAIARSIPGDKPLGCTNAILRMLETSKAGAAALAAARAAAAGDDDEPLSEQAKTVRQFAQLAASCTVIHFAFDEDEEEKTVAATIIRIDGRREYIVRSSIDRVIAAATGAEEVRRCPKCTLVKLVEAFARSTSYCRICERKRVAAANAKKA